MRVRMLLFRRRFVGMLLVACTVGAVRSSHAQAPAWRAWY